MTKKALGRGLGALIPQKPAEPPPAVHPASSHQGGVLALEIGRILPNPHQPRKTFRDQALRELADSIAAKGLIQPVIVRPIGDGTYQLIAGERRWRAAKLAGLATVPAVARVTGSEEAMELALIENVQREDLNAIELALAYQELVAVLGLSHDALATRVGKDRSSITNHLRLLTLPPEIQADVASGALSMGHARAILGIPGKQGQLAARKAVVSRGLSVRETERLVQRIVSPARGRRKTVGSEKDIYIKQLEDSIRRVLGTKVAIRHQGSRGVVELHYFSVEELDRLVHHLRGKETA